jgi:hypothetical protein
LHQFPLVYYPEYPEDFAEAVASTPKITTDFYAKFRRSFLAFPYSSMEFVGTSETFIEILPVIIKGMQYGRYIINIFVL